MQNMKTIRELIKLLPKNLKPSIGFNNQVNIFPGWSSASWEPQDEKLAKVTITWDDIEYIMTIDLVAGQSVRQVGTINQLERKYEKLKAQKEEIND